MKACSNEVFQASRSDADGSCSTADLELERRLTKELSP
jgi:hypothetical protein